jgi:hypothetical protein
LAIFVGSSQGGEKSQKVVAPGIVTVTNMEALFKVKPNSTQYYKQ